METILLESIKEILKKILDNNNDNALKKERYKVKNNKLGDIYIQLVDIINIYPIQSPNAILNLLKDSSFGSPSYRSERFEKILEILDSQIEEHNRQINFKSRTNDEKIIIENEISNIKYCKERIIEIRDKYNEAKLRYNIFKEKNQSLIQVYASTAVKKELVNFEVIINNTFISAGIIDLKDDPVNNIIEKARRSLLNAIRIDLNIKD